MIYYPEHIEGFVKDASNCFPSKQSSNHFYFQVRCTCGADRFTLLKSNLSSVAASCVACAECIIVYDLSYYPAAVKISGEENFQPLCPDIDVPSTVFVQYEYGPDEEDVEFDRNDITWCEVLVELPSGELASVFNDETA